MTAATVISAVPGSSASPPPNHHLTPRLMPVSVHPPLDARDHEGQPCALIGGDNVNLDCDVGACRELYDDGNRSPSPALTVSNGRTTPPSVTDSLTPSSSALASPGPTTISTSSPPPSSGAPPPINPPNAEVGLCSLKDEEELKKALTSKERISVLIIGKEIEAFIGRVQRGEHTSRVQSAEPSTSTSPLDQLGPSKQLDFATTTRYLRMVVYKLASWYGLRAVAGMEKQSMIVGVDGNLDPKSTSLRIASLVPESTEQPMMQFRIMQRDTLSVTDEEGTSRATSVSADDGTESSGARRTFEERELAYAAAKKRIYGPDNADDDSISASASQPRSRQASRHGDEDDDLDGPRRTLPFEREIVYGSLSHAAPETLAAPHMGQGPQGGPPSFNHYDDGYPGMQQPFLGYPNARMMPADPNRLIYPNQQFPGQMPMGGYGSSWPPPPMSGQMVGPSQMQQVMGMMPMGSQGWYPPDMGGPSPQGPNMMSMMPIPQGMPMPYQPSMYGGQQQFQQGRTYNPTLAHPTPMRPGLDPLSSTASSISSRSYQDVHSRPHSRGSTTSTRSAASSVRLGGMYPSGQQPYGYRQKAVKPSQGSFSSSIGRPTFDMKRSGRQSPASTTSSRSSRRASSIHIQQPQPGQHPLPPRPDWAANNVPYHPSPMPPAGGSEPSTSDFPPLHRGPLGAGFRAEPMQVEKVKMRPPAATAWHAGSRDDHHVQQNYGPPDAVEVFVDSHEHGEPAPHYGPDMTTPQQQSPVAPEPALSILQNPDNLATPVAPVLIADADPDFPRRMPPTSRTPSLYDPSAPVPVGRQRHSPAPGPRYPPTALHSPVSPSAPHLSATRTTPVIAKDGTPTEAEVEARFAALSIKSRQPPSYAKIVRRD
ncbi:hypothetical protein CspHIS471_0302020 [Cutaneotrichosporon sp. HIS471]|nr:hypothetical protein CspHIS471_0302020 [Cutaneotrichosporon sp. HIS471]